MSSEQPTKITEWVKANSSVSKVAADLGKSRPTVYRWMELYDEGDRNQLPEEAVAYFDKNIAEGESLTVLRMKASLTEKMMMLSERIAAQQDKIPQFLKQKAELTKEIAIATEELKSSIDNPEPALIDKFKKLKNEEKELDRRIAGYEAELGGLMNEYETVQESLARYDRSVVSIARKSKNIYPIKTTCTIEGNRCMIIHNGKTEFLNYGFVLQLFGRVGDEFIMLKEYHPEVIAHYRIGGIKEFETRNYIIFDDVLPSAPLYYKIVGCTFDEDESSKNGYLIRGLDETNTSGLCELKQTI